MLDAVLWYVAVCARRLCAARVCWQVDGFTGCDTCCDLYEGTTTTSSTVPAASKDEWDRIDVYAGPSGSATGRSTALSADGTIVAVGSPCLGNKAFEDKPQDLNVNVAAGCGTVRVYEQKPNEPTVWTQLGATLQDTTGGNAEFSALPATKAKFGESIALSDDGQARACAYRAVSFLRDCASLPLPLIVHPLRMPNVHTAPPP